MNVWSVLRRGFSIAKLRMPNIIGTIFVLPSKDKAPIYSPHSAILHWRLNHYCIQRMRHFNYRPSSFTPLYSPGFFERSPLYLRRWWPRCIATAHRRRRFRLVFHHNCVGNRRHGHFRCYYWKNLGRRLEKTKTNFTKRRRIQMNRRTSK